MVERVRYGVDGWGGGELGFADALVAWHELPVAAADEIGVHLHQSLVDRIRAYLAGAHETFGDVDLELDWCTPFQRATIEAMRSIPYGETATYGEIAALAGHPNAQRAVGSVCAANRFALFVPCHRVVGADGLGSYGSLGPDYKRRLLELEGVVL
ncbi:MAG TPA: methylated-DNA--[protein]-cysteine S-methyltransferase [Gaiellaceae bacterium]|nr:methylated-DNA--[protein]-cysteine S-methyltransferase [Gaiellaceae bacterium]